MDTIVAPATPAGSGVRAIVRLSGPDAYPLIERVLEVVAVPEPGRTGSGWLPLRADTRLPVLLLGFRAPRSLTGQDVVEIHLPGWPVLVGDLVQRLRDAGARHAVGGEFTARAVATGRMAPERALAVGELAGAGSIEQAQAAALVLTGRAAGRHVALREALLDALALVEAHVDFEEEDTEAVGEAQLRAGLCAARDAAWELAQQAAPTPDDDGITDVVLVGPVNAGKSSLALWLAPTLSTTVSDLPATTRDALSATVQRGGRAWRVWDGPGLEPERMDFGELDRAAMDAFARWLPDAAVVLDVEDATRPGREARREWRRTLITGRPVVRVLTHVDLSPESATLPGECAVSGLTGQGVNGLWRAIEAAAPVPAGALLALAAERRAAADVAPLLGSALGQDLLGALPVVSLALRDALEVLDRSSGSDGADLVEAVLDRIYATFCVGK